MTNHAPLTNNALKALEVGLGSARLRRNVRLGPYTTFQIGGPADYFYEACSGDDLAEVISLARKLDIRYFLLGRGANILIGDKGFRGLVIRNAARHMSVNAETGRLWVESGAIMYPDVIHTAVNCGLSGLEHYVGIPSTVGGALWQNLHFLSPPPDRERTMFIEEVVEGAEILTEDGNRRNVGVEYFAFGYDYSILHDREDVVLSTTFALTPADAGRMEEVMRANLEWRRQRHPPLDTEPSAGSIFKKIEGVGAGRLIDGCGLKGMRIGGAQITRRHANIMINRGDAKASDVMAMIAYVQDVVERETGYRLEPEISFVGEFYPPTTTDPVFEPVERVA